MLEEHENCSVEGKSCINRESKSNDLKLYLYSFHDINMNLLVVVKPTSIYHFDAPPERLTGSPLPGSNFIFWGHWMLKFPMN